MGSERQRDQHADKGRAIPVKARSNRSAKESAWRHQVQEWNSSTRPDFTWWNSRSSRLRSRPTSSPSLSAIS